MKTMVLLESAGVAALALAVAAAAWIAFQPLRLATRVDDGGEPARRASMAPALPDSLYRAAAQSAGFRMTRRLSGARFIAGEPAIVPPPAPRPALALVGVTIGPTRAALVNGIPGRSGTTVLAPHDTAGGVRVRRVLADRVILTGFDTTWTLHVREVR